MALTDWRFFGNADSRRQRFAEKYPCKDGTYLNFSPEYSVLQTLQTFPTIKPQPDSKAKWRCDAIQLENLVQQNVVIPNLDEAFSSCSSSKQPDLFISRNQVLCQAASSSHLLQHLIIWVLNALAIHLAIYPTARGLHSREASLGMSFMGSLLSLI
uniref:Uncharacterized protein n=1 Tax=Coccidioides posadasii RMSCC 3488 TaxID=454284 RepID=A0A0J6FC90_COCPO|nr:hypothetical protein CPAG_04211 [Coccidioides posadasii RMSCC 3488]